MDSAKKNLYLKITLAQENIMTILELKTLFTENLSSHFTTSEGAELYSIFIEKELGYNKFQQRQSENEILSEKQIENFRALISELKTGKPFQQILGETEFYGLKFFVDENVLIPRPETEELLELVIEKIKARSLKSEVIKILDIGTGSGIIPIVLKKHFPQAEISAIDFSEKAKKKKKRNARTINKPFFIFYFDDFQK